MFEGLRFEDYFYAAVVAAVITFIVNRLIAIFTAVYTRPDPDLPPTGALERVLRKCCEKFPNEIVNFQGKVFTRGMNVRVTMRNKKTFEGQFIGVDDNGLLCVLTKTFIAADILDNVLEMVDLADLAEGK